MNEIEQFIEYAKRWLNGLLEEPFVDVMAVNTLTASITALEAQQADRWFITLHNTPKKNGKYKVILFDDWTKRLFESELEYNNGFKSGAENYIIAWKPLPKPWKEEQP